jgi:2-oxo-4-hydroxy-4-carboxy-5-ureidoimidazoline decarboxylase
MSIVMSLDALNVAEPADAERDLLACCAARRWADELIVHRPYHDFQTLQQISDRVFAGLGWDDVEQALGSHPRIGERIDGNATEASWSRAEQSAAASTDAGVQAELRRANHDYEQRFGHVFLICAAERSAEDILAALRSRLGNDEQTERGVVRDELRKIANLRLRKLVGA